MPIYSFPCSTCKKVFEEICKVGEEEITCEKCGSLLKREMSFDAPTIIFKEPQTSSKWENFGYRAKYNMEKAESERRTANDLAKNSKVAPHTAINDFDIKGVFGKDGVDNPNAPGLQVPK